MTWDTGDNHPLRRGVLRDALGFLESRGYDYGKPIGDLGGTYAFLIKLQGKGLYLVARGSRPYRQEGVEYVSSQRVLVTTAAAESRQILMCLWPRDVSEPWFIAYEAQELKRRYAEQLSETSRDNTRKGSKMLNYEYDLGIPIEQPGQLWKVLGKIELARRERQKYASVNTLEEVFGEDPTELVTEKDLVTCSVCRCQYYKGLEMCPGCKASNLLEESTDKGSV